MTESTLLEKATKLCINNAHQYIKDAEILYSFQSYGHTLALTLLSDVEVGKTAIYYLWSQDLISEDILPQPYRRYFEEKQYGLLTAETWWIGLVIASNIEELLQNLLEASEKYSETSDKASTSTKRALSKVVEILDAEKKKISQLEEFRKKSFFVDFNLKEGEVSSPLAVESKLAQEQLQKAKQRLQIAEPFLSLNLSEAPRKIVQLMLKVAFQDILPLRHKISQFILPIREE